MRRIIIKIFLIVALLVALWFVLQWNRQTIDTDVNMGSESSFTVNAIIAQHSFDEGTHRLSGVVTLPTPCWGMEWDALIMESLPEQVLVSFEVSPPPPDEICIQVIDEREFAVEFPASVGASINAEVNGKPVDLILVPQE